MGQSSEPAIVGNTLLVQDETTLATLQDALARSNRDLEQLFTLSLDLICIAGTDGFFKRINPAFSRVLGYTVDELTAVPFLSFVHPEDVEATLEQVAKLAGGALTIAFVNRYRRKDDTYIWLSWKAAPVPEEGLIYALARDITEDRERERALQSREAQLRGVFDAVLDGVITIDARGRVASYNPGAERIFGWQAAEVIGQNVKMLMPEPYQSAHDGYLDSFARTRVPKVIGIGREVTGQNKNGTTFPMDLSVTEIRGEGEIRFVGLVRDLTEKRRLETVANGMLARDAFQQGRIDVASGILHDLGNALTGIASRAVDAESVIKRTGEHGELAAKTAAFLRSNLTSLESALGAAKASALVGLVTALATDMADSRVQALESLAKMINFLSHAQELLSTHRSYSGAGSGPVKEVAAVKKFLNDAVMLTSDSVTKRGGRIQVHCAPDLPPIVLERSRFMQVLVNLVKNAVEACDETEPMTAPIIDLRATRSGEGLAVEVCDNGPGFAREEAENLFQPGYSTKSRGSGTGLGASRRIIEAMGGFLTLHSPGPGKGAMARIALPSKVFQS